MHSLLIVVFPTVLNFAVAKLNVPHEHWVYLWEYKKGHHKHDIQPTCAKVYFLQSFCCQKIIVRSPLSTVHHHILHCLQLTDWSFSLSWSVIILGLSLPQILRLLIFQKNLLGNATPSDPKCPYVGLLTYLSLLYNFLFPLATLSVDFYVAYSTPTKGRKLRRGVVDLCLLFAAPAPIPDNSIPSQLSHLNVTSRKPQSV